jgi:uncharacterized protein (DUF1697 family)
VARCVALLRGVSPMNCRMQALRACLEGAGFDRVKTVLSSGNAVFDARKAATDAIEKRIEAALVSHLGRSFDTFVRTSDEVAAMLAADPFAGNALPAGAKRVVTFLREPPRPALALPIVADGVHIAACIGREVFTAYEPNPRGPVFMKMIEARFGSTNTTRTWDTVRKCVEA